MRIAVSLLGVELLALDIDATTSEPTAMEAGPGGQFEFGFTAPDPRWSPLEADDDRAGGARHAPGRL